MRLVTRAERRFWAVAAAVGLWTAAAIAWPQTVYHPLIAASTVAFTPAGTIAATDVQAALEELDGDVVGVSGGGLVFIAEYTVASNVITITGLSSTYDRYLVLVSGLRPDAGNSGADVRIRTDSDGGASVDAGAADYAYAIQRALFNTDGGGTTSTISASTGATDCTFAANVGAETEGWLGAAGQIWVENRGGASAYAQLTFVSTWQNGDGESGNSHSGTCTRLSAAAIDTIQLRTSISTMDTTLGVARLYGIVDS